MTKKKLYLSLIIAIFLVIQTHIASERPISFDTRYTQSQNAIEGMSEFALEWAELHGRFFDYGQRKWAVYTPKKRKKWLLLNQAVGFAYTGHTTVMPIHEWGHGTRFRAIGIEPLFRTDSGSKRDNYWQFVFDYITQIKPIAHAEEGDRLFATPAGINESDWKNFVTMNGPNATVYFSGRIENALDEGRGHVTLFAPYVYAKLSSLMEAMAEDNEWLEGGRGDITRTVEVYKDKNIDISRSDIKLYSAASMLLSSSHYAFFKGFKQYIKTGNPQVKSLWRNKWRLPDVDMYLNQKGVSYLLKSAVQLTPKTRFLIATEQIIKGNSQSEWHVGLLRNMPNSQSKAVLRLGKGFGGDISFSRPISKDWQAKIGASFYDVDNLYGARNIPSLEDGDTDSLYWARLSRYF